MKMSFRWYGPDDPVTLLNIRQIPNMQAIVTAVYDVPVGEVWSRKSIAALKKQTEGNGLEFMAAKELFNQEQVDAVDPLKSDSDLTLPGWDASYTREELRAVVAEYNKMTEEDLWANLTYFLERIIPVAAECDVNMAIHEDDPCWSIFGLPRIITCEKNLDRFLKIVDDPHNGITLCTGSLGCSAENDVVHMAAKYAAMGRIHFVHARNVAVLENGFEERAHYSACGSLDMYAILNALYKNGFNGYIRPDHGRMIWGETGRAGYGLYDRALGAAYLNGLWEAITKRNSNMER